MTNSITEIRDTDLMFVIGSNTTEAHPIIAMEMKRAKLAGAKLIVADPRSIWLADIGTFDEMNGVWDAWVTPGSPPARACVEARLAAPQFTVEIGVIAARD